MRLATVARDAVFGAYTKLFGNSERMVAVPTLTGPNRGNRFELDLLRHVEPAYFYGTYDKAVLEALSARDLHGKVVWDCGIYLGFYTVFFARAVGATGQVIAFEPDPRNIVRARSNCARNGLSNVSFHQLAIGGPVGETDFLISGIETNSHLPGAYIGGSKTAYHGDERVTETIKVRCVSLDELLQDPQIAKPDLVKLDIEGAELLALNHAERLATDIRPLIALELHNPQCDAKAWAFAERFGYQLRHIETGAVVATAENVSGTLLCEPL